MGLNFQGVGNFKQRINGRTSKPTFQFAVMCSVQTGQTTEHILCQPLFLPVFPQNLANQLGFDHALTPFYIFYDTNVCEYLWGHLTSFEN